MNAIIEKLNSAGSLFVNFSAVMLVQASILILILLALDFLLRKKVRAVFRYCIWLLVLVKLILPPSISSPVSIGNLFGGKLPEIKIDRTEKPDHIEQASKIVKPPASTIIEPKAELYKEIDTAETEVKSLERQREQAKVIEASMAAVEQQQKPAAASVPITWQGTVFLAWVIVLLILILLLIQRALFVRGLVAQADEITGGLNDLVQSCGKLVGMKGKVKLKTSPNATSPAVCGLFRPVILLPQNLAPSLTKEQLKAVLVHELIHIKRGDLLINLFQTLMQIVYFYNPLVWLANAKIKRAREQAVDEAVQVALGESAESYPQILVDVAKLAFKRPALSLRLIGVVENKSALKSRIARMLSRPIPRKAKLSLTGLISVFIVAAVLLPMAAARYEENITEPDTPKFEATLSNGVKVELVGTCQYTESGVNCYRPDGSPLGKSLKISKWNQKPKAGDTGIMLKVTGPEDFSFSYDKILGAKGWEGSCQVINEDGENLEGYEAALTRFDDKQLTTELKFGAAAGAWQTVAEHDGRTMAITNGISFTKAVETEKGVQIFTTDTIGRNVTQRIVAIDSRGRLHPWRGHTGSVSNSQIRQSVGTFPNLKLDQIEKFQFQTRPYEWVEFKNVSVKPNFETNVQIEVETPSKSINGQKLGQSADDRWENADRIGKVTFKEGMFIRDALRFIASSYKKNIIISDKVSGLVPITEIYDVTFEELLEAVLGTHKYVVDGDFIRVYTAEEFESLYPNFETGVKIDDSTGKDAKSDIIKARDEEAIRNVIRDFWQAVDANDINKILEISAEEWIKEWGDGSLSEGLKFIREQREKEIMDNKIDVARPEVIDVFGNDALALIKSIPGEEMIVYYLVKRDNKWNILFLHGMEKTTSIKTFLEEAREHFGIEAEPATEAVNKTGEDESRANSETRTESNLQELIDSARAGQMVTVPKGVYTEPIVINKSLTLKGEDVNDSIIEVTADEPAILVDTKGKGEVTIENLTIKWQLATSDENIEYPFAVAVKDTKAQIKNCSFVPLGNFQRSPVAVRAMGFTNLDIDNCRFEGYNYTIQFGEGTEGILQNSIITNSGHQGVINYSGSTLRVKGNIITGSKFHAVRCTGGKIYVEDNLLINNENRGIYLGNRSASGAITNNIIIGNGTNISGFASSQASITNNIIADAGYAGVSMRDSCRLLIANNIFLKNGRGIILHEETGKNTNRISKNTFWKNVVNFENIEQPAPLIEAEPGLVDPNNGDFSLKSGPVLEQEQGLKKPEVFKVLWKKFKKLEPVEGDFKKENLTI